MWGSPREDKHMDRDIDYGALYGVDLGENGQDVADPADTAADGGQGAQVQEVADPAGEDIEPAGSSGAAGRSGAAGEADETEGDPGEDTDAAGDADAAGEGQAQPPEERARFAAARRRAEAERDAAIEQAKKDAMAEAQRVIDEAFSQSGMVNPFTQVPIRTKAEYDAYRAQLDAETKSRVQKKSGMSDAEFEQFVSNLPEVRAAREAKVQAENAQKQAREQEAKLKVEEQVKQIHALDPTVNTVEDLVKMETYPKLYELVQKGYALADAYRLANFDTLQRSAAAASRQTAINQAQGKQHLTTTTTRGAGAVSVPSDVKEAYRAFNPGATDAEIQKHYSKYMKK